MSQIDRIPDPDKAKEYFDDKMAFTTGPVELSVQIKENKKLNVIDVRAAEDYAKGHIPGAINLPMNKWKDLECLQQDTINVVYCYSHVCHLAARAAALFSGKGYPVQEMDGGYKAWVAHDLPVEQ